LVSAVAGSAQALSPAGRLSCTPLLQS
jgi:hypothetical protein